MTAKGKTSLDLSWSRVNNVDGYDVFFGKCDIKKGKHVSSLKKVKTVKESKTRKYTASGLKKATTYNAYVKAYVMKNGKKVYVRTSPTVHAYTSGGTAKYTNPKSITLKTASLKLKKGKTSKIVARVNKLDSKKKLMPTGHGADLRYKSSDTGIATVSSGVIRAKKKGTCKIYVYSINGVKKTIDLTVR